MAEKAVPTVGNELPRIEDVYPAPIIFFDVCANCSNHDGVVRLTLVAERQLATPDGGIKTDFVAVAHLRCTPAAAAHFRDTINNALFLGAPVQGQSN